MRKLSVCITSWNRVELTLKCFEDVLDDDWISEIVIVDDCSDIEIYNKLAEAVKDMPKVKLFRNEVNLDCFKNKREAISKATNDFCILMDSDNILTKDYVTRIYSQLWVEDIAIMPEWALPNFNYTNYAGLYIDKYNVANYIDLPMFETMLNCANYFVNRDFYLKSFNDSIDPVTSDSLWLNYNWLLNGGMIHVLEGLRYEHLVHSDSHYIKNVHRTGTHREEIIEKIRNLKNEVVV